MNEQLTLQSTQHEETKTVPLRRRKACLAGTFALFAACALVLLIPHPAYAGIIGDEFATAREILLRNMEGNASWRNK